MNVPSSTNRLFKSTNPASWNEAADYASKEIHLLSACIDASISDVRDYFDSMVSKYFNVQGPTASGDWLVLGAKALVWGRKNNYYITQEELITTLVRKQRDYGHHNIAKFGRDGLLIRVHDKVARLENLIANGSDAQNEPIRDTVLDIAGYSVIGVMWDREQFLLELI
jgi:hypothetical protein